MKAVVLKGRLLIEAFEDGVRIKVGNEYLFNSWSKHYELRDMEGENVRIIIEEIEEKLTTESEEE